MRARWPVALLLLGLLPACDRLFGRDEDAVRQAYQSYREAMMTSNLARLKTLVARDKARELETPDAAEMLQMASALYPEGTHIASVQLSGGEATLQLTGRTQGASAQGSVRLVKEDGAWKVSQEDWQVQISVGAAPAAPKEPQLPSSAVRPADYATLLGRWQGGEGGESDWTLTFGEGYAVTGRHTSGAYYSGQAAIFRDLGATSDGIRVPPGWGVMDVQVTQASEVRHVGEVSLGTFSKQGDMLKFCGSEPGTHVRTQSFEAPPAGVRCLTLARAGDAAAIPAPAAPAPAPASAPVVSHQENDGATGQAEVVLDGVPQTYPLFGGFVSDTRFADPRRATIQFKPAQWGSVSGLRLTLDATVTGRHYADGKAIQDMMFNGAEVQVGQDGGRGRAAVLHWVADGGQVFPPKEGCTIEVLSPYTGQPDSVFEGRISGCTVHSGGIDRQLASVKFAMHGAPSR